MELILKSLARAVESEASDLHLVAGHPPALRVHGRLEHLATLAVSHEQAYEAFRQICPEDKRDQLAAERNLDFAFELELGGVTRRFRANYFYSGETLGCCIRLIPSQIPDFHWSGFPDSLADKLLSLRNGLVLVSGVVGSGKTTSLAMLINRFNQLGGYRILTIEDPIEYPFPKVAGSLVTQREVGSDVRSFADGLKFGLRQDPDIILVGEIRDRETAQIALSAAETGHLVFSTLHTRDAKGAISRIADLFPQASQFEVRSQLSLSLRAVISQHLLPHAIPGEKRVLAMEILFNTSAIASAIRFGKLESIDNCILTGRADGMLPLDESLKRLLQDGQITREVAQRFISDPQLLR